VSRSLLAANGLLAGTGGAVPTRELLDMLAHEPCRAVGVAVTHGLEEPVVLLEIPLAEPLEAVDARAPLQHQRDEGLDHRAEDLVVSSLGETYSLLKLGHEVTVVESNRIGSGASFANGGWQCPSQAEPLPEPG
jgi:hypothetical protein